MDAKNKIISVLGDSITEAAYLENKGDSFTELLSKDLNCVVRNYGIGGTCISPGTKSEDPKWDMDFISRVDDMADDANIVIVFGGTNDYGHGVCTVGNIDDRNDTSFYGCLHILYKKLIEKYKNKKIFICTPLHRFNEVKENKTPLRGEGSDKLETFVNIIKEVANLYDLPVIDLYSLTGINPVDIENRNKYTVDGLHPNENGHSQIAKVIEEFILDYE